MKGSLLRILESMPPAMLLRDKSRTWEVGNLIAAIQAGGREWGADPHAYVLFQCRNGTRAIVKVDEQGSLAKTASYLEVR